MLTVAGVLGGLIILLALLVYAGFLAARYFFVPGYPDEIHFARTTDGWRIAVFRYRPEGSPPGGGGAGGVGRPARHLHAGGDPPVGSGGPQPPLAAPPLPDADAGAGLRLLAPIAHPAHPQSGEPGAGDPAPRDGEPDLQLLAQRA